MLDPDGKAKLEETYRALPGVDQARSDHICVFRFHSIGASIRADALLDWQGPVTKGNRIGWRRGLKETGCAMPPQVLFTCAKEGTGVQELADWVVSRLPMGPTLYSKEQARCSAALCPSNSTHRARLSVSVST